jgi:hypothetical protein
MKRIVLALIVAAALSSVSTPAMAYGPYYRPGFRVSVYGGYPYYYRPYYYGPAYYPPPVYYYPPPAPAPVYAPGPVIVPSFSFSFRR